MSGGEDIERDDALLVAEYVLHLLDDDARAAFEARLRAEPALQAQVYAWEAHFVPLAEPIAAVAPPAALKTRVMQAIGGAGDKAQRSRFGWPWRLAGLAVAALVAIVLLATPLLRDPSDGPALQAELVSEDEALILVAGVFPATHEIVIEQQAGSAPEGRALQLWLIAEGADTPVSLGVLDADGSTVIRVPDAIAPGVRTGTIAISDEPLGGSLTGQPTGEILATAQFTET
ncbi:anti-sigma factor domain-containing protein [Paracoccaceae bacterium GXU_MW_L88]